MAINGTNGNDEFRGTRFADEINGFGGNDFFRGSRGADRLDGGSGIDTVNYSISITGAAFPNEHAGEAVNVDLQRQVQIGGFAEGDILASIENVVGSEWDDVIRGNGAANEIRGNAGDDLIEGGDGDDFLFGHGSFSFNGGESGNDVLDGGNGNDTLVGFIGDDLLIGGRGANFLDGADGTDTASYATFTNGIFLNLGNGTNGIMLGLGSDDADTLTNIENIVGSSFADNITGSPIDNVIEGGGGNDVIAGAAGADRLTGGSGVDTASYAGSTTGVNVNLGVVISTSFGVIQTAAGTGAGGDAEGDILNTFESLIGSNFNDNLTGNSLANRLDGRAGDDDIAGGGGNDILIGGAQNDIDRLSGGSGSDTFLYLSRDDSRNAIDVTGDAIQDFAVAVDTIDLQALNIDPANLLIVNLSADGINFSFVAEDANGSGAIDIGEFSILLQIDGSGFASAQNILI